MGGFTVNKIVRAVIAAVVAGVASVSFADGAAIAPKFLWPAADASAVKVNPDKGVTAAPKDGQLAVTFAVGSGEWPGFEIRPAKEAWDLSPWGHVEFQLTNPGEKALNIGLRVDNAGDWRKNPWNTENITLKPGETKIGKVIFGYQYGFKKGFKLDPSKVVAVRVFVSGKSSVDRILLVRDISAAGAVGEKPPVDPSRVVVKPKDGVIPGTPLKVDVIKSGGRVPLKPASGYWNLGDYLKVTAVVKNTGSAPCTPTMKIDANGEPIFVTASAPVAPGAKAKLELPFIPKEPWHAQGDGKNVKPQGGTRFESHRVKSISFSAKDQSASYTVESVKAEKIVADIPAWLGKRPPVPGKWRQTLAEEFNDGKLNEKVWSPYSDNHWDKRTHFTRENILFRDGCCVLKYEKKTGPRNDDPSKGTTDYACGILDSYDHWTQLYGYFEARMKLPTKPGLWPAFWTMPDRGPSAGPERWRRGDTHNGGMEFDIMEHLTAWGPYRFNIACHWDGYEKEHRAIGSGSIYMPADKDGFITVGMLWLPGVYAIYGNGVELARWESDRVANVPAYIFFYMVSGGWANEPLDDDELPDEFAIDWFRAWQLEK